MVYNKMLLYLLSVTRLDNIKQWLPSESSLAIVKGHLDFMKCGEIRDPLFFSPEPGENLTNHIGILGNSIISINRLVGPKTCVSQAMIKIL